MKHLNRLLFWGLVGLIAGAMGLIAALSFGEPVPGNKGIPSKNPDPRIEWVQYPVGGLLLCNPKHPDAKGDGMMCAPLPSNAILLIPVPVTDRDSTDTRQRGSD